MSRLFWFILLALTTWGCTTSQSVSEIDSSQLENPPGIPFRVLAPYTLRVYQKDKNGDYQQVFIKSADLPDENRLFALALKSDYFSNHTLQLNFNNDSTLNASAVTTAITAPAAITAAGAQIAAVSDSINNFDNTRRAQELANLQSQASLQTQQLTNLQNQVKLNQQEIAPSAKETAREGAQVAAAQAFAAVQAAQAALADLSNTATDADRAAAQSKVVVAEIQANQALAAAGLSYRYPVALP